MAHDCHNATEPALAGAGAGAGAGGAVLRYGSSDENSRMMEVVVPSTHAGA
jgi:hypothetical protein